jgi:dCTP deaminase
MILSNVQIIEGIKEGLFQIEPLEGLDPTRSPFNTSAVDLRLASQIVVPACDEPVQLDLRKPGIAKFWASNSKSFKITEEQPYALGPHKFVLAKTVERVAFPLSAGAVCYSARVEGRSSVARCGILIHFTAPTIHAGFEGTITLEIINLGPVEFLLDPNMRICQLIIEEVRGIPTDAPNQFRGQTEVVGVLPPKPLDGAEGK